NWWRMPSGLSGWSRQELRATAPAGAANAQVFLGSGAASRYHFGDVFLDGNGHPEINLLKNGRFADGARGWKLVNDNGHGLVVHDFSKPLSTSLVVSDSELPRLFEAFRPTLTMSASSVGQPVAASITNYIVSLP